MRASVDSMVSPWTAAEGTRALDLSDTDAASGVRAALERGAIAAVGLLGRADGFLGNPKVRIPLPGYLEDAAKLMRKFGQGKAIDELITGMNRAAEAAVPEGDLVQVKPQDLFLVVEVALKAQRQVHLLHLAAQAALAAL